MKKKILVLLTAVIMLMTVVFIPEPAMAASKTGKMYTTFRQGNIVYCQGYNSIYSFNTETEQLGIVYSYSDEGEEPPYGFAVSGHYMYILVQMYSDCGSLYRIDLNTGGMKRLEKKVSHFVVKGSKIYYEKVYWGKYRTHYKNKVMKLNGKKKKFTRFKSRSKWVETNDSNYVVRNISYYDDNGYYEIAPETAYLFTPNGEVFLEADPYY